MEFRDDLHQALGADAAFGDRVIARLDGNHRHDQQRVQIDPGRLAVGDLHELQHHVLGHLVAPGQELSQRLVPGGVRMRSRRGWRCQHTVGHGPGLALHGGIGGLQPLGAVTFVEQQGQGGEAGNQHRQGDHLAGPVRRCRGLNFGGYF